ncbi:MAG: hypothetical protein ACYS99_17955, partial [Planctomycetota bacterium]
MSRQLRPTAIALLLFLITSVPVLGVGDEEPADVEELLGELDAVDSVSGKSVGFGGAESPFYKLFRRLLEAEGEKLPERLLKTSSPVRRSMGLVLLVARDVKKAVPVLRKLLDDRAPVTVNPFGCVYEYGSVGVVARGLLGNRNWIADYSRWEPLLSQEELLAIDLDLLGRDDAVLHHEHVGQDVLDAIKKGKLPLSLAALRKKYPAMPAVRLVKALGRLRGDEYFSDAQKDLDRWVLDLASDRELSVEIRLAAASALCHWRWALEKSPRPFPEK